MQEWAFNFLTSPNFLNIYGESLWLMIMLPAIGLSFGGVLYALDEEKTLRALCLGVMGIVSVICFVNNWGASALENSANYKVGMCFEEDRSVEDSYVAKRTQDFRLEKKAQDSALVMAEKMNLPNQENLRVLVDGINKELAELEIKDKLPAKIHWVVLEQTEGFHLTYLQEAQKINSKFIPNKKTHRVSCSEELNKVVSHYQTTGNLIVSNK